MTATLCGVPLANPVLNASGTLDALAAHAILGDATLGCGAHVTKTVTPLPRPGNPPPRIADAPGGMLNSIGLQNPGIEAFVAETLPALARIVDVPIVASAGGFSLPDYGVMVRALDAAPEVAVIELNLSCPNVETGVLIGADPAETAAVVERVRELTTKPLLAKLSPTSSDVAAVARAAELAGADGLVLANTVRGTAIDRRQGRRSLFGGGGGGLSGPAVRPAALHCVLVARDAVSIDIVGLGGIASVEDARDFLLAGATVVAVGTAIFRDPGIPRRVAEGL